MVQWLRLNVLARVRSVVGEDPTCLKVSSLYPHVQLPINLQQNGTEKVPKSLVRKKDNYVESF